MLEVELKTYEENKERLLTQASAKFVLIRGSEVAGTFAAQEDAVSEGYRRWGNVPFLVKQIVAVDTPLNFLSGLLAI